MNPHPTEIVAKPGTFVQLVEAGNQWRRIHTGQAAAPEVSRSAVQRQLQRMVGR
jgi:hypothetical protein